MTLNCERPSASEAAATSGLRGPVSYSEALVGTHWKDSA